MTQDESPKAKRFQMPKIVMQQRFVVSPLCVLALAILNVGCEGPSRVPSAAKKLEHSPEAEFDWAMERLQRALDRFQPAAHLGLRIKRDLSYQLIPPDKPQFNYSAQVTIKSKTFYKSENRILVEEEEPEPLAGDANFAADSEGDPLSSFRENSIKKPMIVSSQGPAPRIDETRVYELAYSDGRWQLNTQPETKYEQMWFQYALEQ